ncbi:SDR family oxidoreductase [Aquihabitans sp. G128]|uniref:SDR family oxidoreductase n=1 Tax=Aquihabitans sp. G128 TaxID=2849779 RepID=UPI001C222A39|nr:SDR family oxidoreductase [Aquihabitans sp. G128]QXC62652.1 SDR family oxidoreductase [Aquihabitans sp. G128]
MPRSARPDLTGQVVIVTGANAGIGLETAVGLAAKGATVVMTARTRAKGEAALAEVQRRTGSRAVVLGDLDLSAFASIRAFAAWFLERFDRLDVLVANAGLVLDTRRETAEGFEEMFGVNHLGHFLLTSLLQERLVASAPSRVAVLTSVAHRFAVGGLSRADLQSTRAFNGIAAYAQSKLANALFAAELARRLAGTGVTVNAVHPGAIRSRFGRDGDLGVNAWFLTVFGPIVMRSPKAGARTPLKLASSTATSVAGSTGGYWSHGRRWPASRRARDPEEARWLWAESERLVAAASAAPGPEERR